MNIKKGKALPVNIFNIDLDIEVNIGVALHVIAKTSKNRNNKNVLTPEKLSAFMFLVTHPVFLNRVLLIHDREEMFLEETEIINIKDINPAIEDVLKLKNIYALISEMCMKNLITVMKLPDGIFVELTEDGTTALNEMTGWYSQRISIFCNNLKYLANLDSKKVISNIVSII